MGISSQCFRSKIKQKAKAWEYHKQSFLTAKSSKQLNQVVLACFLPTLSW